MKEKLMQNYNNKLFRRESFHKMEISASRKTWEIVLKWRWLDVNVMTHLNAEWLTTNNDPLLILTACDFCAAITRSHLMCCVANFVFISISFFCK